MPRRSKPSDPEGLHARLMDLLDRFEAHLRSDDLRARVVALIPVFQSLRDLGSSLIPKAEANSARDRILHYFLKYPRIPLRGDELMVVSGINEWPRRVRELRKEAGWNIVTGKTAKEMNEEGGFPLEGVDVIAMRNEDYMLLSTDQDREAAHRWNEANRIRRKKGSVKEKILEFLRTNVGRPVTGEELRYVAKDRSEWARRARELRTEEGWPVKTRNTGRPDLEVGRYVLEEDKQSEPHDRNIPDDVRVAVLERDRFKCRKCGWGLDRRQPGDPRQLLELHHVRHHARGGDNTADNLVTLCNVDHDKVHRLQMQEEELAGWLRS